MTQPPKYEPGQLVAEMRAGRAWRVRLVRSNDGITVILDNGSRWTATGSRRAEGHRDEGWTLREISELQRNSLMLDPNDDGRCRDTYALDLWDDPRDEPVAPASNPDPLLPLIFGVVATLTAQWVLALLRAM